MNKLLFWIVKLKSIFGNCTKNSRRGFAMVEILAAVAILATIGTALLSGLMLSTKVMMKIDADQTAKDLAVAQIEYVKNLPFSTTYNPDDTLIPVGSSYTVDISTTSLKPDNNLQKVTIRVMKGGQTIVQLDDYRTQ